MKGWFIGLLAVGVLALGAYLYAHTQDTNSQNAPLEEISTASDSASGAFVPEGIGAIGTLLATVLPKKPSTCSPVPLESVTYEMRETVFAGGTTTLPYFDESQGKCAAARINARIQEKGASYVCAVDDQQTDSEVWSEVTFNESGILSVRVSHDTYCGGPYPDHGYDYLTFDLYTGEEIPLQNLFANYKRDEIALTQLFFDAYARELFMLADGTEAGKENDEGCKEVVQSATWNSYAATKTGIVVEPSLAHAVQACGLSTSVPFAEIEAFLAPGSVLFRIK